MVVGDSLILTTSGTIQIVAIHSTHDVGDIVPPVIPGTSNRSGRAGQVDLRPGRLQEKPFIDINFGPGRMIDDHQAQFIQKVRFPEVRIDPNVVDAVALYHLIAANLHPVGRLRKTALVLRIDVHAQRSAPAEIGDENHPLTIPGVQEWARGLQSLTERDRAPGHCRKFMLKRSVRPNNLEKIDFLGRAQPDANRRLIDELFDDQHAGAHFHFASQPKTVDARISFCVDGSRFDGQRLIPFCPHRLMPLNMSLVVETQKIEYAFFVQIDNVGDRGTAAGNST